MIIIKNYICTLEQAKRLKELGIEQNSLFHWSYEPGNYVVKLSSKNIKHIEKDCAAFTSQELGNFIDNIVVEWFSRWDRDLNIDLFTYCYEDEKWFSYAIEGINIVHGKDWPSRETKTSYEAQARTEFLIYLLEHKEQI